MRSCTLCGLIPVRCHSPQIGKQLITIHNMTFKGDIVHIEDSDKALAIITELGILGDFVQESGPSPLGIAAITYIRHPTHFIAAFRNTDNRTTLKQSYRVVAFHKKAHSEEEVNLFVKMAYAKHGAANVPHVVDLPPNRN